MSVYLSRFGEFPHKIDGSKYENDVKLSLFMNDVYNSQIDKFAGKTLNHAVLDSGCTKHVCSASWLESYLETLSEESRRKVVECSIDSKFKFEDGKTVVQSVNIPAQIGKVEVTIKTGIINNELPLLLSKTPMKKEDTK